MKTKYLRLFLLLNLFIGGLSMISEGRELPKWIPYYNGLWGYADTSGKVVIQPQWEEVSFFKNGRAIVYTKRGRRCTIDTNGHYIIPPYRRWNGKLYSTLEGSYFNARDRRGRYGIIDSNNMEILACKYQLSNFGNSFTESGFFHWSPVFQEYVAKVKKHGKFGIIDALGKTLIPFRYNGIGMNGYPFSSPKFFVVLQKGKSGVIGKNNKIIVKPRYRNIWLDEEDDNQIMLFKKDRTTVIADTTGKIVWQLAGYELGFPRAGLIPVKDSLGEMGLIDTNYRFILPCEYAYVWMQHDTIAVSKIIKNKEGESKQYFKYYDRHNLANLSDWMDYASYKKLPQATQKEGKNLYGRFKIRGKLTEVYEKDNILWGANKYSQTSSKFISLDGTDEKDTSKKYAAIMDTNGNYVILPTLSTNKLKIINEKDSLVLIATANGDAQAIADFQLHLLIHFRPNSLLYAFYFEGKLYLIPFWKLGQYNNYFPDNPVGSWERDKRKCFLLTADYHLAKGFEEYVLEGFIDHFGQSHLFEDEYYMGEYDIHYFLVRNRVGKMGAVDLRGETVLPNISFKYTNIKSAVFGLYLVDNKNETGFSWDGPSYQKAEILRILNPLKEGTKFYATQKGLPYLIKENGQVLLDSFSVESIQMVKGVNKGSLFSVSLKPSLNTQDRIQFYMTKEGLAFWNGLPPEKK